VRRAKDKSEGRQLQGLQTASETQQRLTTAEKEGVALSSRLEAMTRELDALKSKAQEQTYQIQQHDREARASQDRHKDRQDQSMQDKVSEWQQTLERQEQHWRGKLEEQEQTNQAKVDGRDKGWQVKLDDLEARWQQHADELRQRLLSDLQEAERREQEARAREASASQALGQATEREREGGVREQEHRQQAKELEARLGAVAGEVRADKSRHARATRQYKESLGRLMEECRLVRNSHHALHREAAQHMEQTRGYAQDAIGQVLTKQGQVSHAYSQRTAEHVRAQGQEWGEELHRKEEQWRAQGEQGQQENHSLHKSIQDQHTQHQAELVKLRADCTTELQRKDESLASARDAAGRLTAELAELRQQQQDREREWGANAELAMETTQDEHRDLSRSMGQEHARSLHEVGARATGLQDSLSELQRAYDLLKQQHGEAMSRVTALEAEKHALSEQNGELARELTSTGYELKGATQRSGDHQTTHAEAVERIATLVTQQERHRAEFLHVCMIFGGSIAIPPRVQAALLGTSASGGLSFDEACEELTNVVTAFVREHRQQASQQAEPLQARIQALQQELHDLHTSSEGALQGLTASSEEERRRAHTQLEELQAGLEASQQREQTGQRALDKSKAKYEQQRKTGQASVEHAKQETLLEMEMSQAATGAPYRQELDKLRGELQTVKEVHAREMLNKDAFLDRKLGEQKTHLEGIQRIKSLTPRRQTADPALSSTPRRALAVSVSSRDQSTIGTPRNDTVSGSPLARTYSALGTPRTPFGDRAGNNGYSNMGPPSSRQKPLKGLSQQDLDITQPDMDDGGHS
jgi:uncharacterized protein (UPF0335 family)